jgi:hypothetical protein
VDARHAIRRGALVAGVPLIAWTVVLISHGLSFAGIFLIAIVMSIPFFALGARVEQDGDLSSPRRKGTLWVLVALAIVEVGTWQLLAVTSWVVGPLVGIVVWFSAGSTPRHPGTARSERT